MIYLVGLILIFYAIVWIVGQFSEMGVTRKNRELFKEKSKQKYPNRNIDVSKSLFDRNQDIIEIFENRIRAHSTETESSSSTRYRSYSSSKNYFIENLTRDCINEIAIAENNSSVYPDSVYLSSWKPKVSTSWQNLASQIEVSFRKKQKLLLEDEEAVKALKDAEQKERAEKEKKLRMEQWEQEETVKAVERNVNRYASEFKKVKMERRDPLLLKKISKRNEKGDLRIEDISLILASNLHPWSEFEKELIGEPYKIKPFPLFLSNLNTETGIIRSVVFLNNEIEEFNKILEKDNEQEKDVKSFFKNVNDGYIAGKKEEVIERFNFILNSITLPYSVPKEWDIDFDPEERILIAEIKLPDVVHNQIFKEVALKHQSVKKPITLKEQKEIVPSIHPALMLRVAYEIFRNDDADGIKLLVLNGWVEFDDPTTGNITRTYTASLASTKEQIINLKLSKLDPIAAFAGLKGKSAGRLIDLIPVTPVMSLDRKDKRFIETKEVLNKINSETNLASMEWQDFENLIAELFQKEFSEEGTEIKLTQSSRDKGVDAVVFNPDPIRGGKYVIQAKRYTNVVDVSAVRDLVAVVAHEGASRGILVTTSTFGADAYAFVQNKPITLLDGSKLLGLLEKHGYKFRINIIEARKLYPGKKKY